MSIVVFPATAVLYYSIVDGYLLLSLNKNHRMLYMSPIEGDLKTTCFLYTSERKMTNLRHRWL